MPKISRRGYLILHSNIAFRSLLRWADKQQDDIICYNDTNNTAEVENNLWTEKYITSEHKIALLDIITRYWDYFCLRGARGTILDYVFCIDTGVSPPVCCRRPVYGPHEMPIMLDLVTTLKDNDRVKECGGAWGSMNVLAAKPH